MEPYDTIGEAKYLELYLSRRSIRPGEDALS